MKAAAVPLALGWRSGRSRRRAPRPAPRESRAARSRSRRRADARCAPATTRRPCRAVACTSAPRTAPDNRGGRDPGRARRDGDWASIRRRAGGWRRAAAAAPGRPAAARRAHAPLRDRPASARRWQPLVDASYEDWNAGRSTGPRRRADGRRDRGRASTTTGRTPTTSCATPCARTAQRGRAPTWTGDCCCWRSTTPPTPSLVPRGARGRSRPTPTRTSAWRAPRSTSATTPPPRAHELARALAVNPRTRGALALRGRDGARRRGVRGGARRRGGHPAHQPARPRAPPRVEPPRRRCLLDDRGRLRARARPPSGGASARRRVLRLRRRGAGPPAPLRRGARGRRGRASRRPERRRAACRRWARRCCASATRPPGVEALRRAWKRDPYDVRTYNLLNLFEKVIPARYITVASAHLRFRVEPAARAAIESGGRAVPRGDLPRYVARYGFEPKGPVTFELYGDPQPLRGAHRRPARHRRRRASASGG